MTSARRAATGALVGVVGYVMFMAIDAARTFHELAKLPAGTVDLSIQVQYYAMRFLIALVVVPFLIAIFKDGEQSESIFGVEGSGPPGAAGSIAAGDGKATATENRNLALLVVIAAAITIGAVVWVTRSGHKGSGDGPSDDELVATVAKTLKASPESHEYARPGNPLGFCKIKSVKDVSLAQVGIHNEQARYWPVKVNVEGRCAGLAFTAPGQSAPSTVEQDFKGTIEFRVRRDDFGNYEAEQVK